MTKEILINIEPQEKRVVITVDKRLEEFYIERPTDKPILGNIYKGRIDAIVPSIDGAFVDIGLTKRGFLYLSEVLPESIEPVDDAPVSHKARLEVKIGQELLLQVVKEPFGTKGPRLTTHVTLPGRYLVIMPQDPHLGLSRRIEERQERERLKNILKELKLPSDLGFIVRTASMGRTKKEIQRDAYFLMKLWQRIKGFSYRKAAPSLVYEEHDLVLRTIRDSFTDDVLKLTVDSKYEYKRIYHFMRAYLRHLLRRIEFYKQDIPLFEYKDVERQVEQIYERKVFLKCGGYLVIEPTEGLVVIDVNSGSFKKKKSPEEMAFMVNSEAAVEITRQLRLRDLSGIIVIDFIDMEKEHHRREIVSILNKATSLDRAKTDILGISELGLLEMTRERTYRTVESLSYNSCPYCKGRGKVKSVLSVSIYALRKLTRYLKGNPRRASQTSLILHPDVANYLLKEDKVSLLSLERRFRTKINLQPNTQLHLEEIKIA